MINYPEFKTISKADQLLFDLGYSWSLLRQSEELFRQILAPTPNAGGHLPEILEIVERMKEFREHRLQVRSELYDNAEAAAAKGCP